MRRPPQPPVVVASALIAAGGLVHLVEWLRTYRHVPTSVAGSAVVRIGFPANAVLSMVVAGILVVTATRGSRGVAAAIVGGLVFQAASLAILTLSRTGSVLGWMEHLWTPGANQARAAELGALVALAAELCIHNLTRAAPPNANEHA